MTTYVETILCYVPKDLILKDTQVSKHIFTTKIYGKSWILKLNLEQMLIIKRLERI